MTSAAPVLMAFLIAVLCATVAVHAQGLADERYIVVVGEKAPASDVVTGANFAASMRSAIGVTYASALDAEAYAELTDEQVADKTIVVIDGESVRLLGTNPSAERYFRQQGFEVETVDDPTRQDLIVGAARAASPGGDDDTTRMPDTTDDGAGDDVQDDSPTDDGIVPPAREQDPLPDVEGPLPPPQLTVESDQVEEGDAPPQAPAPTPQNETAQPRSGGVLVRVWRWFSDLF